MKMHKVTMYVIDFDGRSADEIVDEIKFYSDGIVHVAEIKEAEIGPFEDEHELNQCDVTTEQHEKYFI